MTVWERAVFTMSATSPASATTVAGATLEGLHQFDWFTVHAKLQGGTGGPLDVYLQRQFTTDVWGEWARFNQLTSGASAVGYEFDSAPQGASCITCGTGTDAAPGSPVLAQGTAGVGHPGSVLRMVFTAGATMTAGATQTVYVVGYRRKT